MFPLKRYCHVIFLVLLSAFATTATYAVSPQLAAGSTHAVVLKSAGTVWAWGDNRLGQVGLPLSTNSSYMPTEVAGLSEITAIAAGGANSAALRNDGTVWTWGDNASGQLGNNTITVSATPVQVSGLSGITAIAVNEGNSLALKSDGTVWAWGDNAFGQLGNGTTVSSNGI